MGVKGLWDIVSPSGIRIKPEALEGQILAIDASIWLKQFLMGLKDKEGKIPQGAHLLGFFKRLCKLLYYGILPVVVFDGAPPDIKRRTLELRRMQREMSEINVRRVANKLLLNTIRLRAARKIRDRVQKGGQDAGETGRLAVLDEEHGEEREGEVSRAPSLFSSEDEGSGSEGVACGLSPSKFKRYGGRYRAAQVVSEAEESLEGASATSYFPVMGFLSERRRLDEMPEIDTNLFAMPVLAGSARKLDSKRMTKIEDLNAFLRSSETGSGERRLMDLPLDAEIDPQVFEQLNSKLQYEILVQLRDAWINALRSNAVDTKDNMSQFSNSQIECYLRYLRINQEIERLKVRMAKECEEQQESAETEIKVIEFGEVYDPDGHHEDCGDGGEQANSSSVFEDESTLTGRIINFSKSSAADARRRSDFGDGLDSSLNAEEMFSIKGYGQLSRMKKKERIRFLQSTNYAKNESIISNPLNTPLFELEKLLSVDSRLELEAQDESKSSFNAFNDAERVKLLRENVEELFNLGCQQPTTKDSSMESKPRLAAGVHEGDSRGSEEDNDWEDIDWENVAVVDHRDRNLESKTLARHIFLSNNIESALLDSILNADIAKEKKKEEDVEIEIEKEKEIKMALDQCDSMIVESEQGETKTPSQRELEAQPSGTGDDNEEVEESSERQQGQEMTRAAVVETEREADESIPRGGQEEGEGFCGMLGRDLDEVLLELEREQQELSLEFGRHDLVLSAEVTREMQYQVCQLLRVLGIPWVDSPGEAEAQASVLTRQNICHGVLSDDSDCFLFGARKIFRNFFSGNCIEMYDLDSVKRFLGIQKQEQFYVLAILLGCDYAVGVNGIGPVNAVEVLKAYPELEDMVLFRDWSMNKFEDQGSDLARDTPERAEFKRNHSNYRHSWVFPPDFPCLDAINAMRSPSTIPDARPVFGKIDRDSTIELMAANTGLTREKVASIIDPIISRSQQGKFKQTRIDGFLQSSGGKRASSSNSRQGRVASVVSKRMKRALAQPPPQVK